MVLSLRIPHPHTPETRNTLESRTMQVAPHHFEHSNHAGFQEFSTAHIGLTLHRPEPSPVCAARISVW